MATNKKPKQKQWWIITVGGVAPIIANYRVFAESEEEGLKLLDTGQAQMDGQPQIDKRKIQKKAVTVKNTLTGMTTYKKSY